MAKSAIVPVLCLIEAILQFFITPPIFAQLTKVKTSYSALTANLTAYWLAKEVKLFEKQGLDVDVVLIESGVTTIQAWSQAKRRSPWAVERLLSAAAWPGAT